MAPDQNFITFVNLNNDTEELLLLIWPNYDVKALIL